MRDPAGCVPVDRLMDVSRSYRHLPCFKAVLPLVVQSNAHTYISECDPADPLGATWLDLAIRGFERMKRWVDDPGRRGDGVPFRNVAIVGTGGGLDAIAVSRIFAPERILASDIHPRALDAARWNIAKYGHPDTQYDVFRSDLFRQYPDGCRFDLVYENLPNVPEEEELLEGIRTASCYRPASYVRESESDRHLLTLHYNFLLEARVRLCRGGRVVCMIGGRIAWSAIADLFSRAGFQASVLEFGLKTQTEPSVVLDGYAQAERNGSPAFTYYHPVKACSEILARHSVGRAESPGTWAESLNRALGPFRVTASDALRLHLRGENVCHSVYAVVGAPTTVDA